MYKGNRKIINATVCQEDGLIFRSKLERSIYKYLVSIGITPEYEKVKFAIWDRDKFSVPYYDRYGKVFKRITRKPTAVHYTPDFIFTYNGILVIVEAKGYKNDAVPYKIRLFRDYLEEHNDGKLCYAVVYSVKDLKLLLNDLNNGKEKSV